MEGIGTNYDRLGTFLLRDDFGNKISKIERDFKKTDEILREIFIQWINLGKSSTWESLVKYLKVCNLLVLAENIEAVIEYCAETNIDLECHREELDGFSTESWNVSVIVMMTVTSILLPAALGIAIFQCKY